MTRLEIIANNSVETDIREALNKVEDNFSFSRLNAVHGRGNSDPKEGNDVWPEENFIYIIYTDDDTAGLFVQAVRRVKEKFALEGIKVIALPFAEPVDLG